MTEPMSDRRSFEAATVLVVDDQPEILRTLSRFLGAKGYCVEIATTVSEAIPLLHAGVRAVVLDVRLPHDSGLELLEFIRRDDRLCELPVLILTGVVLTREEEAMIARDRAYVFYKPKSYETAWNASAKDNLTTGGALENLGYSGATLAGSSRRGSGPRVAHHASILHDQQQSRKRAASESCEHAHVRRQYQQPALGIPFGHALGAITPIRPITVLNEVDPHHGRPRRAAGLLVAT